MNHVLIVGKKFTPLTSYLTDNGYTYTLLQDRLATKFPDKRFKHRVVADFSDRELLLSSVDQLPEPPSMIVSIYENYVLPTAWIAEHLNLPGLSIPAAEACTDKFLMRTLFSNAPEKISPDFAIVESENDVRSFAQAHEFPLILKPANLAKSLLVTKNDTLEELLINYQRSRKLLSSTYKKYAPNRTPKIIIEEFLDGSIHSVDAFIGSDGTPLILDQIVDYRTGYDIGYDDNFHYSRLLPSALNNSEKSALLHCAAVGIRALGIKNSPAHVEVIMTREGPRIVEIGARNGGYRERMYRLANGIDITAAALAVAAGKAPNIHASRNDSCAVLELFAKNEGTFAGISNLSQLRKLPSLNYLSIPSKIGEYAGKSSKGYRANAVIILHHNSPQQFDKDLAYINASCSVITTK